MEKEASDCTNGSFGALLRQLRLAHGLTQEALAERARLGVRTLQGLEAGTRKPQKQTIDRLATGLDLDGERRKALETAGLPTPRRRGNQSPAPANENASPRQAARPSLATFPLSLTSFVGRSQEVRDLKRLLKVSRLMTLTGAGGCGKTRLALQAASEVIADYPDGVWLVELAALTNPSLVAQTIASTLGLPERPDQSPLSVLTTYLQPRRCLLVIDNCEHLVDACAWVITAILQSCPRLTVLTTSRQPLQVSGEVQWAVPPLPTPDPAKLISPVEDIQNLIAQYAAIQLFVERARAVVPGFGLTQRNLTAVAQICWHLDGLPLAIELAAARVGALDVQSLSERIDQRFQLLTNGSRVALPRQQTLQATIDWSYDLLTESERTLFCQLSVFSGGWTLDAAEKVCQDTGVVTTLLGLVEKSLVLAADEADGTKRYRLLETIRQYGLERLERTGEADTIRERHADYFLQLAITVPVPKGFDRLEREHDNLRSALRWYLSHGRAEQALWLSGSLYGFWAFRGHGREGRKHLDAALALPARDVSPKARALALQGAARLAFNQSDFTASGELYARSLEAYREAGDLSKVTQILMAQGHLSREQGDFNRASDLFDEALALARVTGSRVDLSVVLSLRGLLALQTGDYAGARESLEASLQINREQGSEFGAAWAKSRLGHVAHAQGDLARAEQLYAESLATMRQWNDTRGIANLLTNLGMVRVDAGDMISAQEHFQESAEIQKQLQDRAGLAMLLDGFAGLAAARNQFSRALRLAGLAESLRADAGTPLPRNLMEWRDRVLTPARQERTGEDDHPFTEEILTLEQSIAYALSGDDDKLLDPDGFPTTASTTATVTTRSKRGV